MTALASLSTPPRSPSPALPRPRHRGNVKVIVGLVVIGVFVAVALLAPWIMPFDPLHQDPAAALQSPSPEHLLGTDELGRDVLSRLIAASRIDLPIAALATLLPFVLGTALGVVAGYVGGVLDAVVMRVSDLLQAFPTYILMIVLVFSLGAGVPSLLISFTIVGWVVYARLVRVEVLHVREAGYITAAMTMGYSTGRIIIRHVLPNALRQSLVYLSSDFVFALTALAAFSFLGFGIQQPTPEWGSMTASAQPYLTAQPLLTILPGAVITFIAFGFALLGDGLQDRMARR